MRQPTSHLSYFVFIFLSFYATRTDGESPFFVAYKTVYMQWGCGGGEYMRAIGLGSFCDGFELKLLYCLM